MDGYLSFQELKVHEVSGRDYVIEWRTGRSGLTLMALHGGGIEPGTSEVARAVSKGVHAFYHFDGLKRKNNGVLHITSSRFDEPVALSLAAQSWKVITVHGCTNGGADLFVGGLDIELRSRCREVLYQAGFSIGNHPVFQGLQPENMCNRGRAGCGLQLELSLNLRRRLFVSLNRWGRRYPTPIFHDLVHALRQVLAMETVPRGF
ncbi:MAG: poly-gamma-glutamate hydrolase family protein [Desulfosoma sp.]